MKQRGTRRQVTDDQLRQILAFRPFTQLCREIGVKRWTALRLRKKYARDGWVYKKQPEQL